jgi:acyl-CoA synthetase (NDP forming)
MTSAALAAMLRARSIALVGASPRAETLGARMIEEVARSTGSRRIHLVNPKYDMIGGRRCVPTLDEIDEPVDLVLLGVGDHALEEQLAAAARIGARGAVVFGNAHGVALRSAVQDIAQDAGMALCGAGCMGFVNVADGLRATGYLERPELPGGPIALVTHSGSIFSALLRTRRALGFDLAVSSGQELVTTTADYLEYVLDATDAALIGLVLETVRDGPRLIAQLHRAAERDIPVVVLPVGGSPVGAALVTAHSGALAGSRAGWEALSDATGALLVGDLAEFTDTLELLAIGRRARHATGIATVHDSGAERSLVADLADELAVPFAPLSGPTLSRLTALLAPGSVAGNPLDLWGSGADTRKVFGDALRAMAAEPAVSVVALAVDLVEEYDGDTAFPDALLDVHADCDVPLVVLSNLASAVDDAAATRLRAAGVPVLEGTRSGLVALRNLLSLAQAAARPASPPVNDARQREWSARLSAADPLAGAESFALLDAYGIPVVEVRAVADESAAAAAARAIGYPVVLKTDVPGLAHKSDVGGVVVGLDDAEAVRAAYQDLAARLGPRVLVCASAAPGVELALGIARDPQLGPMVVVAAGGTLAELLADRAVTLPPVSRERARAMVGRLRLGALLAGWRGRPRVDLEQVVDAIVALGELAGELGGQLEAVDVNPLIVSAAGVAAVDALVLPRPGARLVSCLSEVDGVPAR